MVNGHSQTLINGTAVAPFTAQISPISDAQASVYFHNEHKTVPEHIH
jgi:hypothetical protein